MAFAAERPAVTSVIVGPRTMEQLEALLQGASLTSVPPARVRPPPPHAPPSALFRATAKSAERPTKPPWSPGNTVGGVPSCSASATALR